VFRDSKYTYAAVIATLLMNFSAKSFLPTSVQTLGRMMGCIKPMNSIEVILTTNLFLFVLLFILKPQYSTIEVQLEER
jgi:hypothetical protein